MARINQTLKPTSKYEETLTQINNVFRIINQENRFEVVREGDSNFPTVQVATTGNGWFNNTGSTTVTHNLGYVPAVFAYANLTKFIPLNYTQTDTIGSTGSMYIWNIDIVADSTEVSFRANVTMLDDAGPRTIDFVGQDVKYYLLKTTAN